MEALEVAQAIQLKISALDNLKPKLDSVIIGACQATANYDKALALTIVRLRNGAEIDMGDNHLIKDPPASVLEKIAKGICWKERLAMDTAEANLKAVYSKIDITQAQLNGYQSINRYLREM